MCFIENINNSNKMNISLSQILFYNQDRKKRSISSLQSSPLDSAQRKRYIKQLDKKERDRVLDLIIKP